MSQRHEFTAEETAKGVQASKAVRSSKAQRRLERAAMQTDLLVGLSGELKEVVLELIRAANSNPIIGVLVAIVSVDLLYRMKILSQDALIATYAFLGLIEGGQVAANLLDAAGNLVGSLIPSIGRQSAAIPNIIQPSATTLVYESTRALATSGEQGALMKLLAGKK